MKQKQIKSSGWWRVLLLIVSLFAGNNVIHAEAAFSDIGMRLYHNPTMLEPYIVAEVLYFDAEGNDSYFTTTAQYDDAMGGKQGPAVYVDGNYNCLKN